jgi:uncharacterized protein (TIGR03546 family)
MLLIIKFLAKAFALLNSEISPKQIAAGIAYGALMGLIPVGSLLPLVLLLLALIINFNLSAVFLAAAIFKILSFAIDPLANQVGYIFLVKMQALKGFWTTLYNLPVVPYTKFNNTIVLGSLIIGLLLLLPVYFAAIAGVNNYRAHWRQKFEQMKIIQAIKASTFFKYYVTYRDWRGE